MSSRRSSRRRDGNDGKQTLEIAKLGGRDHTLKLSKDPDTASKELFAYFREHFPGCTAIAKNAVIFNVGAGSKHSVTLSFKTKENTCGSDYLYGKDPCGVFICTKCREKGSAKKRKGGGTIRAKKKAKQQLK